MKKINLLALILIISISTAFAKLLPTDFTVYGTGAEGTDIAVAASGNVYVASRISAATNTNGLVSPVAYDGYALTKMTHDGQIEWTKFITGNDVNIAYGGKIKCMVDANENVIVTMYVAPGSSNSDLITINDNEQIALSSGSRGCGLLVSYSNDGRTNFSKSYKNIAGGENYTQPFISDIAIDDSGNIFVAGNHYRSFYADAQLIEVHTNANKTAVQTGFILKYSNEGILLSNKTFKSGRGLSNMIVTWNNNNVYCAGKYDFSFFDGENWHKHPNAPAEINHSTYNQGVFIQKMNNSLANIETRYLEVIKEGNSSIESPVSDIYISSNSHIIITGAKGDDQISYGETEVFSAEIGSKKSFIISFDQSFSLDWAHLIGKEGNSQFFVSGNEIAGDSEGNIFLATNARTSVNIGDTILQGGNQYAGVIAKYTEDGDFIHASLLSYGTYDNINAIAFNADKSKMYLTGQSVFSKYQKKFENISPRRYDGNSENSATSMFVCRYNDVEYVDPNILTLKTQFPAYSETNINKVNPVRLSFNKRVMARTDLSINVSTPSTGFQQNITGSEIFVTDTVATFSIANLQDGKKHAIVIPQGFFVDVNNPENAWPKTEEYYLTFSTAVFYPKVTIDFLNDSKSAATWTTTSTTNYHGEILKTGFWSYYIHNMPMHHYTNSFTTNEPSPVWISSSEQKLVVDLSHFSNEIISLVNQVYENNCEINTTIYLRNGDSIQSSISNINQKYLLRGDYSYYPDTISNINATIDSIKFQSPEGYVLAIEISYVATAPNVNLGESRTICYYQPEKLDAGNYLGANYLWNTGETTSYIYANQTQKYSVTVSTSMGQSSDTVDVLVLPKITTSLPDTIYACHGDTVTLNAGNTNYSYLWSLFGDNHSPIQKVTKPGFHSVLVFDEKCMALDSVCVIYNSGARLQASFLQGGMAGYNDIQAQLYKKNAQNQFELYSYRNMPQVIQYDSLPAGDYILKAHFVDYTFAGENPFTDTYHNGSRQWRNVTPFRLTCISDTTINFLLADKLPMNQVAGNSSISGTVNLEITDTNLYPANYKSANLISCQTSLLLYTNTGEYVAQTCTDANGNYTFSNLPANQYFVFVERTGFTQDQPFMVHLNPNSDIKNINFGVNETLKTISIRTGTATTNLSNSAILNISVQPNPMAQNGHIAVQSTHAGMAKICVINNLGQCVQTLQQNINQGNTLIKIEKNHLKGLYIIQISTTSNTATTQVVFQ